MPHGQLAKLEEFSAYEKKFFGSQILPGLFEWLACFERDDNISPKPRTNMFLYQRDERSESEKEVVRMP